MRVRYLVVLLILSSPMSGCILENGEENVQEIPPTDEILDDGSQFTEHCIEYDLSLIHI